MSGLHGSVMFGSLEELHMKEQLMMRKEVTIKEDGRYLIYYHFDEVKEPEPGGEHHV